MVDRYAVMGNPIAHSLSPLVHRLFAEQTGDAYHYDRIKIEPNRFEQQVNDFFSNQGRGLNITLPCKKQAFCLVDNPRVRCLLGRSVNTIWFAQGKLHGDSTDGIGLIRDLTRYCHVEGKNILLLGAGGAASAIIEDLLAAKPAMLTVANRTYVRAKSLQLQFPQLLVVSPMALDSRYDLIINATSAYGGYWESILPSSMLDNKPFCYDLRYQLDGSTDFVNWVKQYGCLAVDGLGMLVEQAAESVLIWRGHMPNTTLILQKIRSSSMHI
ncbi:MAG: shikimate dehydrogenase [Legionella sp.]